jgi:hypothetical protein
MEVSFLKQNTWVRRGAFALLAVLATGLLLWLAVPPLVKSQLERIGTEKLGRTVTVGRVDFKPWTLELTLQDLRVAGVQGTEPQLTVRRIYANAELQSIVRLAPVIDAVAIEAPAVRLTRLADGRYDIDDILAKLAGGPEKPAGEPMRFAVHNITVSEGSVDFDDRTVGRTHELRDFRLDVPFLSNFGSLRDVVTEPRLAFVLDGSAFDSKASSTPFAETRKTDASLVVKDLDLAPYLGYLPAGLPVRLQAGRLDADLRIDFERTGGSSLRIGGTVTAHGAKFADARANELLGFDSLKVTLVDVRPLEGVIHLGEVALAAPRLKLVRDAAGRLDLLATDPTTGTTRPVAAPRPTASAADPATTPAAKPALRVQVDKFALTGGHVAWRDETTRPAAAIEVDRLALDVTAIAWPMTTPARFDGSAAVGGASLKFSGEATDKVVQARAEIADLPLSLAAPYLAQSLVPTLDGKLGGRIDVAWDATATPARLTLKAPRLTADGLALTQGKTVLASAGRFELVDAEVDLANRTLAIASATATAPKVRVERDNERRWMFERWLRTADRPDAVRAPVAVAKTAASAATPPTGADTRPWRLSLGALAVNGGTVSYADAAGSAPVAVEVTALTLAAQKIAPGSANVSPVRLSARIAAGRADAGRIDYQGNVVLQPLSAEGRLDVAGFPAHAFKAYYGDPLNVDIRRAFASYQGTVRFASAPSGITLKLAGDTAVEDFRANSASLTQPGAPGLERGNDRLLSWKSLNLRGFQLALAPSAPLSLDVRETTLTDFFARVIVDPTGRVNLLDLGRGSKSTPNTPVAAGATPAAAVAVTQQRLPDGETVTLAAPAAPAASAASAAAPTAGAASSKTASAAASGPAALLRFGPMSLVNGKIDFTDLFVKPNYSADLSELTGKLSAFTSRPGEKAEMADLELRGKAQQTASLEIFGKINPVAKPLELDITARMRDLDLAPLTPYAVRFAGHGIERGKLSMDINYRISPDGRLAATNKLVLNQLRFGDAVEGAPNSLPVRLAVALLADRNGVIDVDVPISGSLNDPQFSVGSLIMRALGNLIVKAVTSPFSLIARGLGGGGSAGEASVVAFDSGSAVLPAAAKESLDGIAKGLLERPALQMTVVGTANLAMEREGYKRQRLRQLAQAEKRRAAARSGEDAADVAPLTDAEYPALLAAVYKRSEVTKPRNLIGLAKDLPVAEMEALLLADIAVDEESMRQLAVARGAVVRDYLLARKLPSERLFIGAARVRTTPEEGWKPSAQLNLATR